MNSEEAALRDAVSPTTDYPVDVQTATVVFRSRFDNNDEDDEIDILDEIRLISGH